MAERHHRHTVKLDWAWQGLQWTLLVSLTSAVVCATLHCGVPCTALKLIHICDTPMAAEGHTSPKGFDLRDAHILICRTHCHTQGQECGIRFMSHWFWILQSHYAPELVKVYNSRHLFQRVSKLEMEPSCCTHFIAITYSSPRRLHTQMYLGSRRAPSQLKRTLSCSGSLLEIMKDTNHNVVCNLFSDYLSWTLKTHQV